MKKEEKINFKIDNNINLLNKYLNSVTPLFFKKSGYYKNSPV